MTDGKVAPAGLPEKEWFSLDELAERWKCPVDRLMHYAARGMLSMGIISHDLVLFPLGWEKEFPPGLHTGEFIQIPAEVIKRLEQAEGQFAPTGFLIEPKPRVLDEPIEMTLFSRSRDPFGGERTAPLVYWSCLHVHVEERDRFESKHRIGAHAGEMPKAGEEVHPRERQGMLRVIAALDAYIGLPDEVFPTADVILDKLSGCDDLPDRKTIAKYLLKAREVTRYR